jgi:protein-S-isoprenylcysteine O-methyltransferase Ste14
MMENIQIKTSPSYSAMLARISLVFLLILAATFISAGRITYWQGWLFAGTYLVLTVLVLIMFASKKDLLFERFRPGPGVKWWDKIFLSFYIAVSFCILVVSALDAGRFRWSPQLPLACFFAAYIVFLLSYFFVCWAMWTNKFFSSSIRIQTDRGHFVVQDGPYRFVRHPGYLSGIFWWLTAPLVLGSVWGLIPAVLAVIAIIIRTYLEDTTLKNELPGYTNYASKVRYRLIPGLW